MPTMFFRGIDSPFCNAYRQTRGLFRMWITFCLKPARSKRSRFAKTDLMARLPQILRAEKFLRGLGIYLNYPVVISTGIYTTNS